MNGVALSTAFLRIMALAYSSDVGVNHAGTDRGRASLWLSRRDNSRISRSHEAPGFKRQTYSARSDQGLRPHKFGWSGVDPCLVSRLTQITLAKDAASLWFLPFVSMQKTKKSVAKRFKLTAKGKLMRRTPGFRHLLATKSSKQKRRASQDKQVAAGHAAPLKRCLPFGL